MRKCKVCGFPRRYAGFYEWLSDGTVLGTTRPRIGIMFLEVSEWESIFDELSSTLGIPIDHIIIEAQKNIGKDLYEMMKETYHNFDVKKIPTNRLFRPQWFIKAILWFLRKDLAGLGASGLKLERYRPGKYTIIRFTDPCMIPVIVGNCLGIYESVEDMPGSHADYSLEEGELVVRINHADEKSESEDRLYLEEVSPGEGSLTLERCPLCNMPLPFAKMVKWDTETGIISNSLTGERLEVITVQSVNAILRELEKELGADIVWILYNAQKRFSLKKLRGVEIRDPGSFWDHYLVEMAVRGLGYPERFEISGDSLSVDILNAYNQYLYAAKLAAGFEKVTGRGSFIKWELCRRDHGRYGIVTQ